MSDLREQVSRIIADEARYDCNADLAADAVMAVFAERERELRARIEALRMPGDGWRVFGNEQIDLVLAVFDEAASDGE